MSHISALESHVQLLKGKIAIQETVGNLLEQKNQRLRSLTPEDHVQFYQEFRTKKESRENIKKSLLENLQRTGLLLEEIGTLTNFIGLEDLIMKLKGNYQ